MATWVMMDFIYAGMFVKSDSVALTSVPGFATQQECETAGKALKVLTEGSQKVVRYVCVQRTGAK